MRQSRLLISATLGASLAIGLAAAPAATAASRHQASPSSKHTCVSGEANPKASKYNRTPKGAGPWHVPMDSCNTEAYGSSSTPYYNCAYWAAEKRPDIWVNAVAKYGYSTTHPGAWWVKVDAKRAHYPINHKPKVGDVAAWPANGVIGTELNGITHYASPGGHVAYVEKVHKHHRITLSSMGVDGANGGKTFTVKFNKADTYFIHQL